MIDAIRNEHARVYLQDQALLRSIKEGGQSYDLASSIDDVKSDIQRHDGPTLLSAENRSVATAEPILTKPKDAHT